MMAKCILDKQFREHIKFKDINLKGMKHIMKTIDNREFVMKKVCNCQKQEVKNDNKGNYRYCKH